MQIHEAILSGKKQVIEVCLYLTMKCRFTEVCIKVYAVMYFRTRSRVVSFMQPFVLKS